MRDVFNYDLAKIVDPGAYRRVASMNPWAWFAWIATWMKLESFGQVIPTTNGLRWHRVSKARIDLDAFSIR